MVRWTRHNKATVSNNSNQLQLVEFLSRLPFVRKDATSVDRVIVNSKANRLRKAGMDLKQFKATVLNLLRV